MKLTIACVALLHLVSPTSTQPVEQNIIQNAHTEFNKPDCIWNAPSPYRVQMACTFPNHGTGTLPGPSFVQKINEHASWEITPTSYHSGHPDTYIDKTYLILQIRTWNMDTDISYSCMVQTSQGSPVSIDNHFAFGGAHGENSSLHFISKGHQEKYVECTVVARV